MRTISSRAISAVRCVEFDHRPWDARLDRHRGRRVAVLPGDLAVSAMRRST